MAVYTDTRLYTDPPNVHLTELTLYGTSRLGLVNNMTENISPYVYELTDHIGNVRATVLSVKVSGAVEVLSYTDYYPHGSLMPGRHYESSNGYRYDFQGIEKDAELNWNNFELRMYDANLGRWMSPDPYREFHSPYLAMGNDPINRIDPDGGKSMDIASTEPVLYEDYGRRPVDPFDMIGGGGWREESYQWVDGKLISLEDDPYSPYTHEEQVLGRISASKGVSPPSNSNKLIIDFTVTGIMLPDIEVLGGKIVDENIFGAKINYINGHLDNLKITNDGIIDFSGIDLELYNSQGLDVYSLDEFYTRYKNMSYVDIIHEKGLKQGLPAGPIYRMVINPNDGRIMDMRHVMVVGFLLGNVGGHLAEMVQSLGKDSYTSAFNTQDYYSNSIGARFFNYSMFNSVGVNNWTIKFYLWMNGK